jgi:hypothetical protein
MPVVGFLRGVSVDGLGGSGMLGRIAALALLHVGGDPVTRQRMG